MSARNAPPAISIGLAVRNDPDGVRRCIESVLVPGLHRPRARDLRQRLRRRDRRDARASTRARTARVTRRGQPRQHRLAREHEPRPRAVARHPVPLDQRRRLARAAGARRSACEALERQPGRDRRHLGLHDPHAGRGAALRAVPRRVPELSGPARRFERMLWFFHAGDAKYDPVYGIYRREQLMRSGRIRPSERTDWLLSAELALMGPIVHIAELLAHRTRTYPTRGRPGRVQAPPGPGSRRAS